MPWVPCSAPSRYTDSKRNQNRGCFMNSTDKRRKTNTSPGIFILRSGVKKVIGVLPDFVGIHLRPLTRQEIVKINRAKTFKLVRRVRVRNDFKNPFGPPNRSVWPLPLFSVFCCPFEPQAVRVARVKSVENVWTSLAVYGGNDQCS